MSNRDDESGDDLEGAAAERPEAPACEEPRQSEPETETVVPREAPPSEQELTELRKKAAEYDALLDKLKRVTADYLNSQKRLEREKEERVRYAMDQFARELLVVADDLSRAQAAAVEHQTVAKIIEGVELVHKHLYAVLARHEITPIETKVGDPFDPAIHQAISLVETADQEPNRVIHEVHAGFRIHNRLLRPAAVIVSAPPKPEEEPKPKDEGQAAKAE